MAAGELRPLTVQEAYDALDAFGRRAGHLPLRLVLHLSVPQSFRADLVNLLKQNFLSADAGTDLTVDADVLFSPLVQRGAAGYYRLDPEVRRHGVALLDAAYRDQRVRRSVEVARFLLAYADALERQAGLALDPLLSEYLAIQRWVALSFIDPAGAAAAFAGALAEATAPPAARDVSASLRIGGVTSAIAVPLSGHAELLAYARGLDALHQGQDDDAQEMLGWMGDQELVVGNVVLRAGRQVLADWQDRPDAETTESASGTAEVSGQAAPTSSEDRPTEDAPGGSTPQRPVINVPQRLRPGRFVARPEVERVRALLLESSTTPPTDRPRIVRVIGPDGSGRWTLANSVVRETQVLASFPDGIVWLDEGGMGYPTQALAAYAQAVGMTDLLDDDRGLLRRDRFRALFANRRVLIVAEQRIASDVVPTIFTESGPLCTILHLTDYDTTGAPAQVVRLEPLSPAKQIELLSRDRPPSRGLPDEWAAYTGGNPLLLKLAAGAIRKRARLPMKPEQEWQFVDALVGSLWRACPPALRTRLRAVAALRPEHRTLFERAELESVAGSGIFTELQELGMGDLLQGGWVRIPRAARSGLIRAAYDSDDDAPLETEPGADAVETPARVLISFAREDREAAERIAETLHGGGIATRLLFAPTEEPLSLREATTLIHNAAAVIVLMSGASVRNEFVRVVVELTLQERNSRRADTRMVLPVAVEDMEEILLSESPGLLRDFHWVQAPHGDVDTRFVDDVRGLVRSFELRADGAESSDVPAGSAEQATGDDDVSASPAAERPFEFVQQADVAQGSAASADAPNVGDKVPFNADEQQAAIVGSTIVCFTDKVVPDQRRDIVNAVLLAHLVADRKIPEAFDREALEAWYKEYFNALSSIGFAIQESGTAEYSNRGASFDAFDAVLDLATTLLPGSPAQAIVMRTLESLKSMGAGNPWISLFNRESVSANTARFHVALADVDDTGLFLSTVSFSITAKAELTQVLFFRFRTSEATLNYSSAKLTANTSVLTAVREPIAHKIAPFIRSHVAGLKL